MNSSGATASYKPKNKLRRQDIHLKRKKAHEVSKRDERFRRKREEDNDPRLREERRRRNAPQTLERKRTWDEYKSDDEPGLGVSVDLERVKTHQKETSDGQEAEISSQDGVNDDEDEEDSDSMLESGGESESEEAESGHRSGPTRKTQPTRSDRDPRASSPAASTTSARLDLAPAALAAKFPTLFSTEATPTPKILITTSLNSTLHHEAQLLTTLFPNAVYIPRSAHRYGHKFSVREIAKFASNRDHTSLFVLKEDQKKPAGVTIVHLPSGPSFHFSISNWVEGKKLPGHGNPTDHVPELIFNNFRTPLGLLTAHLFRSIFPPQPELQGRQVVTLHNQRDYIFVRRHRYIFRDKRPTEKTVVGSDGKEMKGAEGIRAGLQELGPRFTLKLRRIDPGIGRAGSNGQVEWEWKGSMEKQRTKFQL
ncbi:MAG: hypothetical protein M1816_001857 [Peltula sp. TS41687]|nr:MAG: hypothetical protein M1816_001857 [Peltula sp. TS41687]